MPDTRRCTWPGDDQLMQRYHDIEWGVPVHDDRKHFEFLVLDAFQAGLSWRTILHRREGFRRAFADFDPQSVASFNRRQVERLLRDESIIRNRLKVESTISNAREFLRVQAEFGSFDAFVWELVGGQTRHNRHRSAKQIPATSPVSDAMSKALKKRGFRFVGSTICYAYMQAAGMVNDHLVSCFRYSELR